jgi:two-component system CheB/CheR fusion protein
VVFAVQNIISDPPFSNLDLISCRNLLIYLEPAMQKKLIALFHFALNKTGYLFLGSAETIGQQDDLFEPISKRWRVYRRIGPTRRYDLDFPILPRRDETGEPQTPRSPVLTDSARLGELIQQLLLQDYAPASVLVNHKYHILYYYGPIDHYLKQPTGTPTEELMVRARQGLTIKLRAALNTALRDDARVTVGDAQVLRNGDYHRARITVKPINNPKPIEGLLLVSFEDEPESSTKLEPRPNSTGNEASLIQQLEYELKTTREELQNTIENQESSNEELKVANEEVMSVNEELQSTNEELETSKEELQSLNEELTTVNTQLQDKVGELEAANNDLDNLLTSTDIATIFLDTQFQIKRFTPPTTRLLNLISTDVGRPLSDISSPFTEGDLLEDIGSVLQKLVPREKEVCTKDRSYIRRIVPYRADDNRIEGVVITFIDITARNCAEAALLQSKQFADRANRTKSRFLAAASHDLRQPLQTLNLLTGLLAMKTQDPQLQDVINSQLETLTSMRESLDAFLNLSKLEAGVITPKITNFRVDRLLKRIQTEFKYEANHKGLVFRVVPCSAIIRSDPVLLERIVRNLASNAVKHTDAGKVLIGCRRRGSKLRLEVWDTGIGIPRDQLQLIFDVFYQVKNPTDEFSKGLGLGLSIVEQLARLLGHPLDLRSAVGKGSMFAVETPLGQPQPTTDSKEAQALPYSAKLEQRESALNNITVLLVENDPSVLQALKWLLEEYGAWVITAGNAQEALECAQQKETRLDLLIVDYRLPQNENGIELIERIRALGRPLPAILMTGDTSPQVLRRIEQCPCELLHKPMNADALVTLIHRMIEVSGTEA